MSGRAASAERGRAEITARRTGGRLHARRPIAESPVHSQPAAFGPVLVIDLVDEDLDLIWPHPVRVDKRLSDPGDEPALGVDVARRLLDGDDGHDEGPSMPDFYLRMPRSTNASRTMPAVPVP